MEFGNGPWKGGRLCAASLCYRGLDAAQLQMIAANHAAVGIRGTLLATVDEGLEPFRQRNWDVRLNTEALEGPAARHAVPDVKLIEGTLATHEWTVWLLDGDKLDALGADGHAAILRWLGDYHDRVWCAPVRDIAAFRPA